MDEAYLSRHYTENHLAEIKKAKTYDELAVVGIKVLKSMPQPIGMVCGPVTSGGVGNVKENIRRLKYAMHKLTQEGKIIFNQAQFEDAMREFLTTYGKTKEESNLILLEGFYKRVFESGLLKILYFMPDWQSSFGATWEREQGKRLGLEIIDLPESFINK